MTHNNGVLQISHTVAYQWRGASERCGFIQVVAWSLVLFVMFYRSLFVLFLLAIVLSVLLRIRYSDYLFGLFKLVLLEPSPVWFKTALIICYARPKISQNSIRDLAPMDYWPTNENTTGKILTAIFSTYYYRIANIELSDWLIVSWIFIYENSSGYDL